MTKKPKKESFRDKKLPECKKKSDTEWEDDERDCDSSHSLVHREMVIR